MVNPHDQQAFLISLIKSCEYYNLSETESLGVINHILVKHISRSTYYNYKKKLYDDEKFQSLKKSIYKSKLSKCSLLYLDETDEPDGFDMQENIIEQFPDRHSIFHPSKEQEEHISMVNNKIKSNFCIPDVSKDPPY